MHVYTNTHTQYKRTPFLFFILLQGKTDFGVMTWIWTETSLAETQACRGPHPLSHEDLPFLKLSSEKGRAPRSRQFASVAHKHRNHVSGIFPHTGRWGFPPVSSACSIHILSLVLSCRCSFHRSPTQVPRNLRRASLHTRRDVYQSLLWEEILHSFSL